MSYALVTGAAKGIGKAIAIELAKRHYNLLLVDIDAAALTNSAEEIKTKTGVAVEVLHQDLSQPDAANKIKFWSNAYHHALTLVVNNAGFGLNGAFEELSIEEQIGILDVNIKAKLALTHA